MRKINMGKHLYMISNHTRNSFFPIFYFRLKEFQIKISSQILYILTRLLWILIRVRDFFYAPIKREENKKKEKKNYRGSRGLVIGGAGTEGFNGSVRREKSIIGRRMKNRKLRIISVIHGSAITMTK